MPLGVMTPPAFGPYDDIGPVCSNYQQCHDTPGLRALRQQSIEVSSDQCHDTPGLRALRLLLTLFRVPGVS